MPDNKNLIDAMKEQLAIDALLNNLDRNLFYLPVRIQYDDYLKRLIDRKIKEDKRPRVAVETDYEINWNSLIPTKWLELNPNISEHFETPVTLRTTFIKEIIKTQILVFYNAAAADIIFELFRSNSMWQTVKKPDGGEHLQSSDGKCIIDIISSDSDFDFLPSNYRLMLLYKG